MSITVYWGSVEEEWLRSKKPELVYKKFAQNLKNNISEVQMCPSVKDYMKNTFFIKSIYDYSFYITEDKKVLSNMYNQKFFDDHVVVRDINEQIFSFSQTSVFFTEEKSLLMSAINPYMENNNITKKCITIPGSIDIGKWFRTTDFAFFLKKEYNDFSIKEEEIFQYIKFYTDKKIIFKQFKVNQKLREYLNDVNNAKNSRILKSRKIEEYYNMFKNKKQIIKEIKNNLI
jgi:hypothetical protein